MTDESAGKAVFDGLDGRVLSGVVSDMPAGQRDDDGGARGVPRRTIVASDDAGPVEIPRIT